MSSLESAVVEEHMPSELRRSLRKKYNMKATRVQSIQNGVTHRPVLLKEGYLHKPAFFRFGGKRKRYCVLRTYSSTEASLDIFVDDSKCRYKGSICLDRSANPTMLVRTTDVDGASSKRGKLLTTYIILKVGKNTYHFTTESMNDLKEWCALLRQVIYPGNLFSAKVVEPQDMDDGMINVQFSSTYIALLCPVREISLKRWRMEHITSFGQCGGMLTFECCSRCSSDANTRCSLNIKQEKPAAILSAMEKMIRDNPKTSEIHYERSILGDIYHCSHQCGSKMFSAVSDTDLHKLTAPNNRRNKLEASLPPPDLSTAQEFDFHTNTLDSNDSGFPGTPHLEDSPRSSSHLSSPSYSGGKPSPIKKLPSPPTFVRTRSCSEDPRYTQMPSIESNPPIENSTRGIPCGGRTTSYQERENNFTASLPISYSPIKTSKESYNKLEPVSEVVNRYASNGPPTPPERRESRQAYPKSNSPPLMFNHTGYGSPTRSRVVPITIGKTPPPPKVLATRQKSSDGRSSRCDQVRDSSSDRDQPVAELAPPVPARPHMLRRNTDLVTHELPGSLPRQRSHSQSDVLDSDDFIPARHALKSTSEEEDSGSSYDNLAELKSFNPMFRLDDLEYDETDGDHIHEVMSNLADYRRQKGINHGAYVKPAVIDKVLSKVACDTVKGYAYKISIPVAGNVVYDVPRRLAVEADPKHDNPYAPPKPIRKPTKTELLDHCISPAKNFPTTPVVSTEA